MPGRKELCGFGTSFEAKRWLSLDPCGCLGISFSWAVHWYALTVLAFKVIPPLTSSNLIYFVGYLPVSILAMLSLCQASTTDPGAVPMGARPFTTVRRAPSGELTAVTSQRSIRRCHKCHNNYKPARAHHDSVTGRCIVKFDHYCPWINNAVGALNHKYFCLFLFYTAISCLLSLLLILLKVIHCGNYINSFTKSTDSSMTADAAAAAVGNYGGALDAALSDNVVIEGSQQQQAVAGDNNYLLPAYPDECRDFFQDHFVTVLAIASLIFLVFTIAMGCEQSEAIETGKGKIARMQQSVGKAGTELSKVTEEFNEMFGGNSPRVAWHWYLPIPVRFPRGMKQVVLGYEFNDTCQPVPYKEPGTDDSDNLEAGNAALMEPLPVGTDAGRDGIFRETSDGSIKNRRTTSRTSDDNSSEEGGLFRDIADGSNNNRRTDMSSDEGITLVERAKMRLS